MKFINVTIGPNGPTVDPDRCEVDAEDKVLLRTGEGVEVPFAIDFDGPSPAGPHANPHQDSKKEHARQVVKLDIDNVAGVYKYTITANGIPLDPAIIIR